MPKNDFFEVCVEGKVVKVNVNAEDFVSKTLVVKVLLLGDYQFAPEEYQLAKAFVVFAGDIDAMMAGILNWHIEAITIKNGAGLKISGNPQQILAKAKGFEEFVSSSLKRRLNCVSIINRGIAKSLQHALTRQERLDEHFNPSRPQIGI